ncbi:MAG: PRC-barrel domain-containing protein [Candidatus Magasanikbacteria bacterium]|nr:PRC-barrel domain-containing protein [Candidatus Magasanikbacteria bacterium]
MRISLKQLKKMSVETQSGVVLGVMKDMVFDVDTQSIIQYEVGSLLGETVLIAPSQIVRFEQHKVIVEDTVRKVSSISQMKKVVSGADPVMMREDA